MSLLSVDKLVVEYAGGPAPLRVVDGVSFDLSAGGTLGLVGESGCGKTTTALALMGLLAPAARAVRGIIRFDGVELVALDETARGRLRGDRMAMVFQDAHGALNPVRPVGDQVGEPLRIHRGLSRAAARAQAIELLARVGIGDAAHCAASYPHQLSGGMHKRALLAMALACGPSLLIADEPTGALDVTVQAQVLALLDARVRKQAMALLLITHDLGVAAERCDEVAVMYAGQIVERAAVRDLFARPAHPYTAGLIRSLPRGDVEHARLEAIPGAVPPPREWPGGCRFRARCGRAQPRCEQEMPELRASGQGREVRCWFPIEVGA